MLESRTLTITINCAPQKLAQFVTDPRNLPQWASGLCQSVSQTGDGWQIDTPQGPATLRFVEKNSFGILDHHVSFGAGKRVFVPMRVVANGDGSEVIFTLFRAPDMSDAAFAADVDAVQRDLQALKHCLENGR